MEVKMGEKKAKEEKKLSYEELEQLAVQLGERCKAMSQKLEEKDFQILIMRLDYLFKVLDMKSSFSEDFTKYCADEITKILSSKEEK